MTFYTKDSNGSLVPFGKHDPSVPSYIDDNQLTEEQVAALNEAFDCLALGRHQALASRLRAAFPLAFQDKS